MFAQSLLYYVGVNLKFKQTWDLQQNISKKNQNILQKHYTINQRFYQLKLPIELDCIILDNSSEIWEINSELRNANKCFATT